MTLVEIPGPLLVAALQKHGGDDPDRAAIDALLVYLELENSPEMIEDVDVSKYVPSESEQTQEGVVR